MILYIYFSKLFILLDLFIFLSTTFTLVTWMFIRINGETKNFWVTTTVAISIALKLQNK